MQGILADALPGRPRPPLRLARHDSSVVRRGSQGYEGAGVLREPVLLRSADVQRGHLAKLMKSKELLSQGPSSQCPVKVRFPPFPPFWLGTFEAPRPEHDRECRRFAASYGTRRPARSYRCVKVRCRVGRGRASPYWPQGLITSKPHASKSPTLRLASCAPRDRVMPAICASNCVIGRPAARLVALISAKASAAALSKVSTCPSRSMSKMLIAASHSPSRRFPLGKTRMPYRISALVMIVVNIEARGCSPSHSTTRGSGAARTSSDRTLVSRTITYRGLRVRASHRAERFRDRRRQRAQCESGWPQRALPRARARATKPCAGCRAPHSPSSGHVWPPGCAVGPSVFHRCPEWSCWPRRISINH